jgi:hypothetical protein
MQMEKHYDKKLKKVFDILRLLLADENESKNEIGFGYKEVK